MKKTILRKMKVEEVEEVTDEDDPPSELEISSSEEEKQSITSSTDAKVAGLPNIAPDGKVLAPC